MAAKRNVTSQATFPYTHGHGRTEVLQTPGARETTQAVRMKTKTLIKQTSFVVSLLRYFENIVFSYGKHL